MTIPKIACCEGLFFNNKNEKTGTKTTLNPVIKPAFAEVVYINPAVCAAYPTKSQKPMNTPENKIRRSSIFNCWRSKRSSQISRRRPAIVKRTPLKEKGSKNAIAFCTMTNVDPHTRAISSREISARMKLVSKYASNLSF